MPAAWREWNRLFGALLGILVCFLVLTGTVLALYYTPAPGSAYDSVDFVQYKVPFGGVIRGVHHYAWNALLIVMALHMLRAFIVGAHKAPRRAVWISGAFFWLLVPLFIVTGDLLPWDQRAYWSTQVRLGIIGSVPWVGDFLVRVLQGGPLLGITALTRFYVLHILILPGALALLIALHAYWVMQRGLASPAAARPSVPLAPLIRRALVAFVTASFVLGVAAWWWPAPLGDPADPTDTSYVPQPEWWVLPLNQLVTLFKGQLAVLGTTILPLGLFVLMAAAPFLDRGPERHPAQRGMVMIVAGIIIAILLGLSVAGYYEHHVLPEVGPR